MLGSCRVLHAPEGATWAQCTGDTCRQGVWLVQVWTAETLMGSRLHAPDAYSLAIQQTGREKPLSAPVLPKTQ